MIEQMKGRLKLSGEIANLMASQLSDKKREGQVNLTGTSLFAIAAGLNIKTSKQA